MRPYAIGTFSSAGGHRFAGLVLDGRAAPINRLAARASCALPGRSILDLLNNWPSTSGVLEQLADDADPRGPDWHAIEELRIHPPVDLPRQVFCTGANYRKHVVDLAVDAGVGPSGLDSEGLRVWAEGMIDARLATGMPYVFTKPVSAIAGPDDDLILPATSTQVDWELELGVVIGIGGYGISREAALSHVAGYAVVNDISARDLIARTDYPQIGTDWLRAKGQPGFLPFGPYIVPSPFIVDPHDLAMTLTVSGQVMQYETTADMLFNIARQIEYISAHCHLFPGDLICTGSPAGNGTHYGRYLGPGDTMTGEITGLGRQHIRCVAPREIA